MHVKLLLRVLGVMVVALALLAPVAASVHCDGDSECSTACPCVRCSETGIIGFDDEAVLSAEGGPHVTIPDVLSRGRLLVADIFRPPAAA
jgi:hypothetical protein